MLDNVHRITHDARHRRMSKLNDVPHKSKTNLYARYVVSVMNTPVKNTFHPLNSFSKRKINKTKGRTSILQLYFELQMLPSNLQLRVLSLYRSEYVVDE